MDEFRLKMAGCNLKIPKITDFGWFPIRSEYPRFEWRMQVEKRGETSETNAKPPEKLYEPLLAYDSPIIFTRSCILHYFHSKLHSIQNLLVLRWGFDGNRVGTWRSSLTFNCEISGSRGVQSTSRKFVPPGTPYCLRTGVRFHFLRRTKSGIFTSIFFTNPEQKYTFEVVYIVKD